MILCVRSCFETGWTPRWHWSCRPGRVGHWHGNHGACPAVPCERQTVSQLTALIGMRRGLALFQKSESPEPRPWALGHKNGTLKAMSKVSWRASPPGFLLVSSFRTPQPGPETESRRFPSTDPQARRGLAFRSLHFVGQVLNKNRH